MSDIRVWLGDMYYCFVSGTVFFCLISQAVDLRGTTPLLASYKNGHFEVVEWLLAHVAHLPSDPECNKALLAPMPVDTDLAPQRSKCIELIMKVL